MLKTENMTRVKKIINIFTTVATHTNYCITHQTANLLN